jgi:hypothetical protein
MVALYRAGRQVEALDAYRTARRTLVEQAGVEPGPALRELERRVLSQDAALSAPDAPPRRQRVRKEPSPRRRTAFVVVTLIAAVTAAVAGSRVAHRTSRAVEVGPQTVAVVDPASGHIIDAVPVGPEGGGSNA